MSRSVLTVCLWAVAVLGLLHTEALAQSGELAARASGVLHMLQGKASAVLGTTRTEFAAQLHRIRKDKKLWEDFQSRLAQRIERLGVDEAIEEVFKENSPERIREVEKQLGEYVFVETEKERSGYVKLGKLTYAGMIGEREGAGMVDIDKVNWLDDKTKRKHPLLFTVEPKTPFFLEEPQKNAPPDGMFDSGIEAIMWGNYSQKIITWSLPFPICVVFYRCD